eukprot:426932-Heterocapsa_arctica.AAC.1
MQRCRHPPILSRAGKHTPQALELRTWVAAQPLKAFGVKRRGCATLLLQEARTERPLSSTGFTSSSSSPTSTASW